jgi:hypothetical protein
MTIETGPSDLEDCARPNGFEIDLGVIAVAMPFISGIWILVKNPDWRGFDAGGESLAAPRGVSDASRRCKQRPSKFSSDNGFFSQIEFALVTLKIAHNGLRYNCFRPMS